VFNGYGDLTVSVSDGLFSFDGAYFTSWSMNDEDYTLSSSTITMLGYLNGSLVGSITYDLTNDFQYYEAGFSSVDQIVFQSSGIGKWWLMDDMTINSASVPEPATILLLGTGLLGLVGASRKKLKK
jgi:hypothetical protein